MERGKRGREEEEEEEEGEKRQNAYDKKKGEKKGKTRTIAGRQVGIPQQPRKRFKPRPALETLRYFRVPCR